MIGVCVDCGAAGQVNRSKLCAECREDRQTIDFHKPATLAPFPTTFAPGTPAKVLVMEKRAKAQLAVFHPYDARFAGDSLPVWFCSQPEAKRKALIESKPKENSLDFSRFLLTLANV